MTEEEANVAILRDAYVAWGSLADGKPGMEFTSPRASREEVVGYFEGLAKDWCMEFYHINEYVAQGGRVVALGEMSWTHKRTGKKVTMPKVDVWLFENGKATQFMEHFDTHMAISACED